MFKSLFKIPLSIIFDNSFGISKSEAIPINIKIKIKYVDLVFNSSLIILIFFIIYKESFQSFLYNKVINNF